MTDIEISNLCKKEKITDIASKLAIDKDDLVLYGDYKAKIKMHDYNSKGSLILVTAISPTPFGEGKTTVSIGLVDALAKMGEKSIACLREPSMGPVFGMKGGATGGGYSQVVPMDDINLHFTGDFHAITSANNLISACIDNHIYFGNQLDIQEVTFNRCLDVNDRALRKVSLSSRNDSFSITSASEIMALFCLASSYDDLRDKLGNIVVGINSKGKFVYVKDLNIVGSLMALLKDAFMPNLVQTLEKNPAIIHGGPFANIAHGCNSVVGTKTALSLADWVITEAGFGADLGAEKFFDIKCATTGLKPNTVVLVCTIKALKYHGGVSKDEIFTTNNEALVKGFANLDKHYQNLKKYGIEVVVCLNRYNTDTEEEINILREYAEEKNYLFAVSDAYTNGGEGATSLAKIIINNSNESIFKPLYDYKSVDIADKINIVCKEIYGASNVNYSDESLRKMEILKDNGCASLPVCIAKTQYSFSDDPKKVGACSDFEVTVRDIKLYNGAGMITVLLGDIVVMPGLSRKPNCEIIDFCDGVIVNLN